MESFKSFEPEIYSVNAQSFDDIALKIFRNQAANNLTYKTYLNHLGKRPSKIDAVNDIPFLPISFFKTQIVKTDNWEPELIFTSSGTTSSLTSKHLVKQLSHYQLNTQKNFQFFFGDLDSYNFLALLPSYLERAGSSLICMMDYFIQKSDSPLSGYYLNNLETLALDLKKTSDSSKKTILWGVSYALLDLIDKLGPIDLSHCMVFETGGMKGRRREITRLELHEKIKESLKVRQVYSEYGMTELFSQAYTKGTERFFCPPWMKILGRDASDPLHKGLLNETSGINVVDLANWATISFVETEDLGRVYSDGSFEILGRLDNSDIRGCNLLID